MQLIRHAKRAAVISTAGITLLVPAVAGAQGPVSDTYSPIPPASGVQGAGAGSGPSTGTTSSGPTTSAATTPSTQTTQATSQGSLPFTGLDLGLLVGGGATMLGVGLGLRRLSQPTA